MPKVFTTELPKSALSSSYQAQGAFVDCYYLDIDQDIGLGKYIQAFYTTPLFKLERSLLSLATFKRAGDDDALELSLGKSDRYSIWTVEEREKNQILMREFTGNTRSWFMVKKANGSETKTRLYFGSVVVPKGKTKNGQASFGGLFHLLGSFHQIYSKALLSAAYKRLLNN